MAAAHHTDTEGLAGRLAGAIEQYRRLGVDGDGQLHYLSDDRSRVCVIGHEPERDLVEEADRVQAIDGDVDRWLDYVETKRGWRSFDPETVVALARERAREAE